MIEHQRCLPATTAEGLLKFLTLHRRVVDGNEDDGVILALVIEKVLAVLSPQIKDRLHRRRPRCRASMESFSASDPPSKASV